MPKTTPTPTLEQQRARHAWDKSKSCSKEYTNLAKGLPALIINSGLMQVMAFLEQKKGGEHEQLAGHLRGWLHQRKGVPEDFEGCMEHLLQTEPREFQEITTEAMAWLRWMRQIAAAQHGGDDPAQSRSDGPVEGPDARRGGQ